MRAFTVAFFLFTVLNYMIAFSFEADSSFRSTKEWKKILGGQRLTPGLWLRIDIKANIREAKIPSEKELRELGLALGLISEDGELYDLDLEEMRDMIKRINPKKYLITERKSKKYLSVMEFKQDLAPLNIQFKCEFEILMDLVMNFKKYEFNKMVLPNGETSVVVPKDQEVLTGLVDLEYLIHQTENAMEFARMNGFVDVIHKCLNSTNNEIRAEALTLHGSATLSNSDMQIAAFEAGSVPILLKVLSSDKDERVRAKSLYALHCLLRQFPAAQLKWITHGGLTVFASLFDNNKAVPLALQLKAAILFQDLLLERQGVLLSLIEEDNKYPVTKKLAELKKRQRQYDEINLNRRMIELNWCSRISNWVVKQNVLDEFERAKDIAKDLSPTVSDLHNVVKKMINTIYAMSDMCKSNFIYQKKLVELIDHLLYIYSVLVVAEPQDDKNHGNIYTNLLHVLEIIDEKMKKEFLRGGQKY